MFPSTESSPPADDLRVLIAEDHRLVADALTTMFSLAGGFEVCGQTESGGEAVELFIRLSPDLVLMDVSLDGLNGVEATRRIVEADPDAKILVLTMHDDTDTIASAIAAGALGFVPKNADREDLFRAVAAVAAGDAYLHQKATRDLLSRVAPLVNADSPVERLTAREHEVLKLLTEGLSSKEIASSLSVGEQTIKTHLSHIYQKLGAVDRAQAVAIGLRRGLID